MIKSLTLLLTILFSTGLSAQEINKKYHHHEFGGSLSVGSNPADNTVRDIRSQYCDRYHLTNQGECFDILGESFAMINFEYHYRFNQTFALGFIFGWGTSSESYAGDDNELGNNLIQWSCGDEESRIFYVAPSFRCSWCHLDKISLYSRIAFGAMRQHMIINYGEAIVDLGKTTQWEHRDYYLPELSYDKVKWKPTYHVTFVGFDFGTEPVNLYMEVGYGCQDVFAVGIRYAL